MALRQKAHSIFNVIARQDDACYEALHNAAFLVFVSKVPHCCCVCYQFLSKVERNTVVIRLRLGAVLQGSFLSIELVDAVSQHIRRYVVFLIQFHELCYAPVDFPNTFFDFLVLDDGDGLRMAGGYIGYQFR